MSVSCPMSQQYLPHIEQHARHDLSALQNSQQAQTAWLGRQQQQQQQQQGQAGVSAPLPFASGQAVHGESDYLDGATQSRVEDWASQACAATLHRQVRIFSHARQPMCSSRLLSFDECHRRTILTSSRGFARRCFCMWSIATCPATS